MKVKFICIGKTGKDFLISGEQEYLKRLTHYISIERIEIPDLKNAKKLSVDQIKELEERFQHYDINNHEKDRLIWQYLVNRKNRRDNDPKQNEIDTDWGN